MSIQAKGPSDRRGDTLAGQIKGDDPDFLPLMLDRVIVGLDPSVHLFAYMPGSVAQDRDQSHLAQIVQFRTAPVHLQYSLLLYICCI